MIGLALLLALGEEYLTRGQAIQLALPGAERVLERTIELDEGTRRRVGERYGGPVALRQTVLVGEQDGKIAGYAMILTEVTKTLRATFIVSVGPSGQVVEVAVMSHEDHIGTDCRKQRFVSQFRGKTIENRLTCPNGGILPVSGATLSCQAVARAVRKAVAIVQYHFLDRPENQEGALREDRDRQKRYLMGTFLTITAPGAPEVVGRAFEEVKRLERVISNYDERSELSRLSRDRKIKASGDLLEFLRSSKRYSEETGGAFDVTVGPLVGLWGFKDGKYRVPAEEELALGLSKVGWKGVEIDGREVRLKEGVDLDPGAIGKGMAVDRAAAVLRKAGVTRALVDFGSSAFALGRWEVAIRDPFGGEKTLGTVVLEDESLSTSGNYEKAFQVNGKTYSHILDPRTGRPVEGVASASVIAPTGAESDARATAAFVLKALPDRLPGLLVPERGAAIANEAWRNRRRGSSE